MAPPGSTSSFHRERRRRPRSVDPRSPDPRSAAPWHRGQGSARTTIVSGRTPSYFMASAAASDCRALWNVSMSGHSTSSPTRFDFRGRRTSVRSCRGGRRTPTGAVTRASGRRRPPRGKSSGLSCPLAFLWHQLSSPSRALRPASQWREPLAMAQTGGRAPGGPGPLTTPNARRPLRVFGLCGHRRRHLTVEVSPSEMARPAVKGAI